MVDTNTVIAAACCLMMLVQTIILYYFRIRNVEEISSKAVREFLREPRHVLPRTTATQIPKKKQRPGSRSNEREHEIEQARIKRGRQKEPWLGLN